MDKNIIDKIQTAQDLAVFVRALLDDFQNNQDRWESLTLEQYLEAMAGWLEGSKGYYQNVNRPIPDASSWQTVASVLLAASMYE